MSDPERIDLSGASLQSHPWPPVAAFFGGPLPRLLTLDSAELAAELRESRRRSAHEHFSTLSVPLGIASAYFLGYADSPVFQRRDAITESRIYSAKLILEDELLDTLAALAQLNPSTPSTQEELAERLRSRIVRNEALGHPLFPFLADHVDAAGLRFFLASEVTRNEVVDDEVAMLPLGVQGPMKAAAVLNLADEVGVTRRLRSRLTRFHTYWLRELLEGLGTREEIVTWREEAPAFRLLTSVTFMAMLTRPGLRLSGYGSFVMSESWVSHHFEYVMAAMERHGLAGCDRYFRAHARIDPHHTDELLAAIEHQVPRLTPREVTLVEHGAEIMLAAKVASSDQMLEFLRGGGAVS